MSRAPWRRRRATDSPRPAGRRWAGRLRRSGSLARQVLLTTGGVARRRTGSTAAGVTALIPAQPGNHPPLSGVSTAVLDELRPTPNGHRIDATFAPVPAAMIAPVSPAPAGASTVGVDAAASGMSIPLLPGERTLARQIKFTAVNACTVSSLLLGVSAIFVALGGNDIRVAAFCLMACVVFDGLDGALARRLGVSSPFGAQMDSLADMCSFGIAAPVVVYAWLSGTAPAMAVGGACALVAVCAAIRLARFNVSPKDGRFFCGVPTTMAAAVLALSTLIGPHVPPVARVAAVALLALAMVSSFPYVKLARLLRLPAWLWLVPLGGAMIDYKVTFGLIVLAYLASGPLLWLRQRQQGGSTRTAAA